MLCSDKPSREVAAEIWIKANAENNMNNILLGRILGKMEHGNYAPLKRFTDLLIANCFNVSNEHNKNLLLLLDNMLSAMNETSMRGLKKLLEISLMN